MSNGGANGSLIAGSISKSLAVGWICSVTILPPDEGLEWNRFLNGHLLKATAKIPFLVPLATVPMQSGKLAAQALEEALNQGSTAP